MGVIQLNRNVVKRVIAACDFGWTNPGAIGTFAIDGDGRAYLVHEIYQTQRTIDWWIEQAKKVKQQFGIEVFICDPSSPSYIEQFRRAGLNAVEATNDIVPGIDALKERLQVQPDGQARFYVYESALEHRDESREDMHQPYCFEQEILEYVWPKQKDGQAIKEVPVKVNDHAMDMVRYLAMYLAGPNASSLIAAVKERAERQQKQQQAAVAPPARRPYWQ